MVNKYTAFALRGTGSRDGAVGSGVYGLELQKSLRRLSETSNHLLCELKIRTPLTNRTIGEMALVSWGAEDGTTDQKDAVLRNACFPLESCAFGRPELPDGDVEEHGRRPDTMYISTKLARKQARLFNEIYGGRTYRRSGEFH